MRSIITRREKKVMEISTNKANVFSSIKTHAPSFTRSTSIYLFRAYYTQPFEIRLSRIQIKRRMNPKNIHRLWHSHSLQNQSIQSQVNCEQELVIREFDTAICFFHSLNEYLILIRILMLLIFLSLTSIHNIISTIIIDIVV